jgi:hypothetical protein
MKSSQFFALHHLAEWGMNHDRENMDRLDVSAQSGCKTLQQKNQAYAGNDHHDEDVGHIQNIGTKQFSHEPKAYERWLGPWEKHEKKCEAKH